MQKSAVVGLDIGTSKIKIIAIPYSDSNGNLDIIKKGSGVSLGVRKGRIEDPDKIFNIVSSLFDELVSVEGIEVDKVFVNVNGAALESMVSKANVVVSKADQTISQEDIERALKSSQTVSLLPNREVLGVYNKEFIIDGHDVVKNPIGLRGTRLEAKSLLVTAFAPALNNIKEVMDRLGVDYEIIPSPLASSYAVLRPEQKELGVCLVDIGAATTGIAVFFEGDLVFLKSYPFGSNNITSDIAIKLQLDFDTADYIKKETATCSPGQSFNKKERIKTEDGQEICFLRKDLSYAVQARANQMLEVVMNDLNSLNLPDRLPGGVVFTGGGSNFDKFVDYARKFLKLPAKKGSVPSQFRNIIEDDGEYACALGLALIGYEEDEGGAREKSFKMRPGKIGSVFKKFLKMFIP